MENPKKRFESLDAPFCLLVGSEDEFFVAEKLLAYGELGRSVHKRVSVVPGQGHFGILGVAHKQLGEWVMSIPGVKDFVAVTEGIERSLGLSERAVTVAGETASSATSATGSTETIDSTASSLINSWLDLAKRFQDGLLEAKYPTRFHESFDGEWLAFRGPAVPAGRPIVAVVLFFSVASTTVLLDELLSKFGIYGIQIDMRGKH